MISDYLEQVKKNGKDLEHVPERMRTYLVCKTAIENDWHTLEIIIRGYLQGKNSKPKQAQHLALVSDLCLDSLKQSPFAVRLIPDEILTEIKDQNKLKLIKKYQMFVLQHDQEHHIRFRVNELSPNMEDIYDKEEKEKEKEKEKQKHEDEDEEENEEAELQLISTGDETCH